jgi:hypothetical protein
MGAFVYGFMILADKLLNGLAIALVQALIPQDSGQGFFFTLVVSLVCGGAGLTGLIFTGSLSCNGRRNGNEIASSSD